MLFCSGGSGWSVDAVLFWWEWMECRWCSVLVGVDEALKLVLDEKLRTKFLLLCKQCKAVLCCRVSPSQKAAVCKMVKKGLDVMTLSIGDGANDVAMIQEADVGVGIAGEEGRQAVMCSDYAIGQFRFLGRLMLVHGRWSYRRLAEMTANFFYKVRMALNGVVKPC